MQNQQITEVDSHKHLGLYLSNDCTWHKHINYITEIAWTRIKIMRRLKFKLDRKSLEQIYLVLSAWRYVFGLARRSSTIGFHLLWHTVELAMNTRLWLL